MPTHEQQIYKPKHSTCLGVDAANPHPQRAEQVLHVLHKVLDVLKRQPLALHLAQRAARRRHALRRALVLQTVAATVR